MDFSSILKQSQAFKKLALKVSLTKNTDSFLSKLNEIKDFDDRIKFANEHLEKVGEGSSRVVFKFKDKILKLSKNKKGLAQNIQESLPNMRRDCVNKVLASDIDGKWIVVNFAEKITRKEFEKLTGMKFDDFSESLFYKFNNETATKKPSKYEEICQNELFDCVVNLVKDNDLQIGDINRISSWSKVNNKAVLTDYGLSRDIYEKFYA
jgi:hypothetical protein